MDTQAFSQIFPTNEISQLDQILLVSYFERASEFMSNFSDLTSGMGYISYNFHKSNSGKIESQNTTNFNRHRMKGLYVDYRALWANDDDSNFLQSLSRIGKYFEQPEWRSESRLLKKSWLEENSLASWGGHKFEDISKIVFNYRFFHTAQDKRKDYESLHTSFCEGSLDAVLFLGIQRRGYPIKNLRWILQDFRQPGNPIRIPKSR